MKNKTLIGNTPLIKINFKYKNIIRYVYVKLEYYNFTGSIKDRMAAYIIKSAKEKKLLKENQPIVEATSGNTGISFAALGAKLKHPVYIFMPNWVSRERVNLIKMYGANVTLVSKKEGGFLECIRRANILARNIGGYKPEQFNNNDNIMAHYTSTASEILELVKPKGVVSGIGTGGTLMGVGKRLKENDKNSKVIAVEPLQLAILSKSQKEGMHKIEGIGDDFIPDIVDKRLIDEIILVDDNDAINMSRKIASELGIGVGISSGANFLAAVMSGIDGLVTFFVDDSKKYLSTELVGEIDNDNNFISNMVKIIDFEIIDWKAIIT